MFTPLQYVVLALAVAALVVFVVIASRSIQKRVRFGSPAHPEFRDEWLGDDTDHHDAE